MARLALTKHVLAKMSTALFRGISPCRQALSSGVFAAKMGSKIVNFGGGPAPEKRQQSRVGAGLIRLPASSCSLSRW
jgi:hypothetical protein